MRRTVLAGTLALVTAACAPAGAGPAAAPTPRPTLVTPTGSPTAEQAENRAEAVRVLAQWDAAVADTSDRIAVIAYGGDAQANWTGAAGEWEPTLQLSAKMAEVSGQVSAATALSTEAPPPGTVVWADGRRRDVGLVSPADALRALQAGKIQDCGECVPLRVTGATLGTARLDTVRGEATAPAWEFTVEATAGLLTRVAVAPSDVYPIAPRTTGTDHFPQPERATVDATGLRLTSEFIGAPGGRDKTCGADYTSEVVESDRAVVVIVYEHRNPTEVVCPSIGRSRAVTNTLATPLDDRTVVELSRGVPVPVTRG